MSETIMLIDAAEHKVEDMWAKISKLLTLQFRELLSGKVRNVLYKHPIFNVGT
jgi:hypothetical protein